MTGDAETGETGAGRIAFWLLPAGPWEGVLKETIEDLARRFCGPVFAPHVTVYVDDDPWRSGLGEHVAGACREIDTIQLSVEGVSAGDCFTESLFLRLETGAGIAALSRLLRQTGRKDAGFGLNPHLSLVYGCFGPEEKDRMVALLPGLPGTIGFDRLAAVFIPPGPVASGEDVARWELRCWSPLGARKGQ